MSRPACPPARVGQILHADHDLAPIDDATLRHWFAAMRDRSLTRELEVGAIKEWSRDGERTFGLETPAWRWAVALGAPLPQSRWTSR